MACPGVIPPGKTWFDTLSKSFSEVDTAPGISTKEFLQAAESTATLFGAVVQTPIPSVHPYSGLNTWLTVK
jgi:hypothetical protein